MYNYFMEQTPVKNNLVASVADAHYANLFVRIVANVIDNFLISILTFFMMVILTFSSFDVFSIDSFAKLFVTDLTLQNEEVIDYRMIEGALFFIVYTMALYTLLSLVYFQSLLSSKHHSTFGMRLFKLRLVALGETPLSFNRIFVRNVLFIFLKFVYVGGLSVFTIAFTKDRQALHDMVVGTTVSSDK